MFRLIVCFVAGFAFIGAQRSCPLNTIPSEDPEACLRFCNPSVVNNDEQSCKTKGCECPDDATLLYDIRSGKCLSKKNCEMLLECRNDFGPNSINNENYDGTDGSEKCVCRDGFAFRSIGNKKKCLPVITIPTIGPTTEAVTGIIL